MVECLLLAVHLWSKMRCVPPSIPLPFRDALCKGIFCWRDLLMSGCQWDHNGLMPFGTLPRQKKHYFALQKLRTWSWASCSQTAYSEVECSVPSFSLDPFMAAVQVLDVAHLHNNELHLSQANNSAAPCSSAQSWFPNLVSTNTQQRHLKHFSTF